MNVNGVPVRIYLKWAVLRTLAELIPVLYFAAAMLGGWLTVELMAGDRFEALVTGALTLWSAVKGVWRMTE